MTAFSASETRTCLACGKTIKGRVDKKFCDDYCRNNYNNQQKAKSNYTTLIRNINNALLKNRKILESLKGDKEENVSARREKLLQLGFNFKYTTHSFKNKEGKTYFWCYDYGYLPFDNDWILIVKTKEE